MNPISSGPIDDAEHDREQRPAVAQRVLELLADDDARICRRSCARRSFARSPVRAPASATNASSRLSCPVCARSSSGVPRATTRPAAMTTIESQSAETSCMTWLENSTQRPSRLQPPHDRAHGARAHHVEAVGRLVEQHVLRVVHQRAGERHLGALAVREARRAPIGDRRSCRAARAAPSCAARSAVPLMPCSSPK